jgi:hypothetical protein
MARYAREMSRFENFYPTGLLDWLELLHREDPGMFDDIPEDDRGLRDWLSERVADYYRSPVRANILRTIGDWGRDAENMTRRLNYCVAQTRWGGEYLCGCLRCVPPGNRDGFYMEGDLIARLRAWREDPESEARRVLRRALLRATSTSKPRETRRSRSPGRTGGRRGR